MEAADFLDASAEGAGTDSSLSMDGAESSVDALGSVEARIDRLGAALADDELLGAVLDEGAPRPGDERPGAGPEGPGPSPAANAGRAVSPPGPHTPMGAPPGSVPANLNRMLVDHGFEPLSAAAALSADAEATLRAVLQALGRRDAQLGELATLSASSSAAQRRISAEARRLESRAAVAAGSASASERRYDSLRDEFESEKEAFSRERRTLRQSLRKAEAQVKRSEHRVREREALCDALTAKLRDAIARDRAGRERDQRALADRRAALRGAPPRAQELLRAQDAQLRRLEGDVDALRGEVSGLHAVLKEKENAIVRLSRSPMAAEEESGDAEWRERCLKLQRALRGCAAREKALRKALEGREEELSGLRGALSEAEAAAEALRVELSGRPTLKAFKDQRGRLRDLEERLSAAQSAANAEEERRKLSRFVDNAELMRRDRKNRSLDLFRIDALPRDVATEVLQGLCRELDTGDVALLVPSVRRLCAATASLPRLQRFVKSVCAFVFEKDAQDRGDNRYERRRMEEVLPILQAWRP